MFNDEHRSEGCGDNESREWYKGVCVKWWPCLIYYEIGIYGNTTDPAWYVGASLNDYKRCKTLAILQHLKGKTIILFK